MPKLFDLELEGRVKGLASCNYGPTVIVRKLNAEGTTISRSTVERILGNVGKRRKARENYVEFKQKSIRPKRVDSLIKKIDIETDKRNPLSQRSLANKYGVSQSTINRVIHKDLNKRTLKKTQVQRLNDRQKRNREVNSIKLLKSHFKKENMEFVVTIDETWLHFTNCNKDTVHSYVKNGKEIPRDWVVESTENFDKKFMAAGTITGRGAIPLFAIPPTVKIDSEAYLNFVLVPLVTEYLPDLYPNEMNKVFIHDDAAPSHVSRKTAEGMDKLS